MTPEAASSAAASPGPVPALRRPPLVALAWALGFLWLVVAVLLATAGSVASARDMLGLLRGDRHRQLYTAATIVALGLGVGASVAAALLAPHWRRRALLLFALAPMALLVLTSRNLLAVAAAGALLVPGAWAGREFARWAAPGLDGPSSWLVGAALWLGALGAGGLLLANLGLLRPWVLWPVLVVVGALLVRRAGGRLRAESGQLARWLARPITPSWFETLAAGLVLAFTWINASGALAPEAGPDAMRARTAAALLFARTGRLAVDPELGLSRAPGLGELAYATSLTIGPLQTAKVINFAVWALCLATMFALGRRFGGARGSLLAAAVFATLPLGAWLARTAYVDLWTALFVIAAAVLVLSGSRLGWRGAILTGLLLGSGVGVKLTLAPIAGGLVLAMALSELWRQRSPRPLLATALAGLLLVAVAWPWVGPGIASMLRLGGALVTRDRTREVSSVIQLSGFGLGHSATAFARVPFAAVLDSQLFGENQRGFLGYLAFGLAPFALLARPRHVALPALLGIAVAYAAWFMTVQYLRYALPFLLLLVVLAAWGYAWWSRNVAGAWGRAAADLLLLALLALGVSGFLGAMLVTSGYDTYRVALGAQSTTSYLAAAIPEYRALQLLNRESGATRAYADSELARLYSNVRISSPFSTDPGLAFNGADAEVWRKLDAGGYTHVIVDRNNMPGYGDEMAVMSEEFLRRNALLVGGGNNVYLYRLVRPEQRGIEQTWARGPDLLANGGFEQERGNLASGWTGFGRPRIDATGQESRSGQVAVLSAPDNGLVTTVPVTPSRAYLLTHATRGTETSSLARLQLNWLDATGRLVGVSLEVVPATPAGYFLRSMLATSPAGATTVAIYAVAQRGAVWFDDVSLRPLEPDPGMAPSGPIPPTSRPPLVIRGLRPGGTRAGVPFDTTAAGASVLKIDAKNALPGTRVWVDGRELPARVVDRRLVTVALPPELLAAPGRHQVVLRNEGGATPPTVFVVEP